MYSKSLSTKENIILTVIRLLELKDVDEISTSDIAKEAEVAVGLINYHFKSKENLLEVAIDYFINETIKKESSDISAMGLEPEEKLRNSIKGYSDFLARHRKMCRLFFLKSLTNDKPVESTKLGFEYYVPLLKELLNEDDESDIVIIIYQIINTVQISFLRNDMLKGATKLDFFSKEDRDKLVDKLISNVIFKGRL